MAELMDIWLRGYCLARGLAAPEVVPEGFWVEVAKPQQIGRYILNRFKPAAILILIHRIDESAVYIEFPGTKAQAMPIMPEGWGFRDDAYLMRTRLLAPSPESSDPLPYSFDAVSQGSVSTISVHTAEGDFVGFGCQAITDGFAIVDQVSVEPAYRRRGVGRRIMAMLAQQAVQSGIYQGLLVATEDGRSLYQSLGWQEVAQIISMISYVPPVVHRNAL